MLLSNTMCWILKQVKENGATEVVDYTKGDVVEHFTRQEESETKKFDIVYDSATNSGGGEDYREKSLKLLKQDESNHGGFCSVGGPKCVLKLISGQYVAINGAASMWARNFTIGQKKNEHLVRNLPKISTWLLYQFLFSQFLWWFFRWLQI